MKPGECPLSGVKRTSRFQSVMSAFDPKRTLASPKSRKGMSDRNHSALMPAALMIGHHFAISPFCRAVRASGVC
jgi:hypothetical protein